MIVTLNYEQKRDNSLMDEKYKESCMKFSSEELKRYFIDTIRKGVQSDLDIRIISEDGEEIDADSDQRIETIIFGGKEENLFIYFLGVQTSIFCFDQEIMFIDEKSKGIYTSSDVYGNVVYEGNLREMTHEEMLQMFADIILCFVDAAGVSVVQSDVPEDSNYKRYNYYEPHMFIVNVENNPIIGKTKIYENITINY